MRPSSSPDRRAARLGARPGGPSSGKTEGRGRGRSRSWRTTRRRARRLVGVSPQPDGGQAFKLVAPLYVASADVLAHYGITASTASTPAPTCSPLCHRPRRRPARPLVPTASRIARPELQTVDLPRDTSEPNAVITTDAIARLGLQPPFPPC